MNQIFFEPWIGKNYSSGSYFDKKILILGESHYGNNLGRTMTKDILNNHTYSKQTYSAFTNFERALYGDYTDKETRRLIWASVSFYNYVQECLLEARIPPTKEQFFKSENAFFEVLEILNPDVIIVWGKRLWENLPYTGFSSLDDAYYDGYKYRRGTYTIKSGEQFLIYELQHPSSGFSWSWWHDFMKANNIVK